MEVREEKPADPRAFTNPIQSVVPVAGSNQWQPVIAQSQAVIERPRAVFVEGSRTEMSMSLQRSFPSAATETGRCRSRVVTRSFLENGGLEAQGKIGGVQLSGG